MRIKKLTLKEKKDIIQLLYEYTPIEEISKSYNVSKVSIWRIWKNYKYSESGEYNCKVCNKIVFFDKVWGKRTPYMYGNMCSHCLNESNERFLKEQVRWSKVNNG